MRFILLVTTVAAGVVGCSGGDGGAPLQAAATVVPPEDGLAEAYGIFKQTFVNDGEDQHFHLGYGFHPGLSSTKILVDGAPVSGQAILDFGAGLVTATLHAPTDGAGFDLYFVKNSVGGGTVEPERGDEIFRVGRFAPDPRLGPNQYSLSVPVGSAPFPAPGVNFDLDLIVVTLAGQDPTANIVAVGARTLFEKRFFRERAGAALDAVTGTLADDVETTDPLVRRGSQLFFAETFGGNGRTCGTCHPLEHNLTIDPAFVAQLPANDPLFTGPDGLEDAALLTQALIRENVDGFDDPRGKFVERSVPHTLAMSTSIGEVATGLGMNNAPTTGIDGPPPDQRTGWSGDGAPGRGTLHEFAFGAVVQHFTRSLARVPGSDFRIPTQAELDALEAFQLFSGRQHNVPTQLLGFGDPAAQSGRDSMLNEAQCVACHRDIIGDPATNFDFDTGVERLALPFRTATNMPGDGGFGSVRDANTGRFGNGRFNVPPLFEAADTAPLFHNNGAATIEDAVTFYSSQEFLASPGSNFARPFINGDTIANIAGFLRTINALTNIAQVRKRVAFLASHATPGGARIMQVAIADTKDAIRDLSVPSLHAPATANAVVALRTVELTLENTLPFADAPPEAPLIQALTWLEEARRDLVPTNPNADF
jgi:cytochrome c peroxidase